MAGAVMMGVALLTIFAVCAYLLGTMARSIQNEKRTSMSLWKGPARHRADLENRRDPAE